MTEKGRKQRVPQNPRSEVDAHRVATAFFSVTWSIAILFTVLPPFSTKLPALQCLLLSATTAASIWSLFSPASMLRIVVVSSLVTLTFASSMPRVNNHELLMMIVGMSAVITYGRLKWNYARWSPVTWNEFYEALSPSLRLSILVVYLWAALHKLNTGYFDKDLSSATMQLYNLGNNSVFGMRLSFIPTDNLARLAAIYGTLFLEACIPTLLIFRRTRLIGIALALVFHLILGVCYAAFSAFVFSQLALFLPLSFWRTVLERWPNSALDRSVHYFTTWYSVRNWAAILFGCGTGYMLLHRAEHSAQFRIPMCSTCWSVYGMLLIGLYVWSIVGISPYLQEPSPLFRNHRVVLAAVPILVFLNGLSPHIGLKSTQSFAMYSNLRTEGGKSNHLFIPVTWQCFNYLKDLVAIKASSDPVLSDLSRPSWRGHGDSPALATTIYNNGLPERFLTAPTWKIPFVSLRQHIAFLRESGVKDISLTYERGGIVRHLDRAEHDAEISHLEYWERRFFRLRAVPDTAEGCAMW